MTMLHSVDFFKSGVSAVAIEPRLPQSAFPEHHHDFHEIVIVEHGTGIHVFKSTSPIPSAADRCALSAITIVISTSTRIIYA